MPIAGKRVGDDITCRQNLLLLKHFNASCGIHRAAVFQWFRLEKKYSILSFVVINQRIDMIWMQFEAMPNRFDVFIT